MKNKLDLDINLYQEKGRKSFYLGETISGFLKIRPIEDLAIEELGFHLVKVSIDEEIILSCPVSTNETLSHYEIYRFPFKFINHNYESFKGKKLKINFKLKPYLITKTEGKIKDETKTYPINFLEKRDIWTSTPYLDFYTQQPKYTIPRQNKTLVHNSCFPILMYG